MKRKFTKITALLVTVALLMAVPTLSAYANEENTTAVLSESAAQSTTNNIKEARPFPRTGKRQIIRKAPHSHRLQNL